MSKFTPLLREGERLSPEGSLLREGERLSPEGPVSRTVYLVHAVQYERRVNSIFKEPRLSAAEQLMVISNEK